MSEVSTWSTTAASNNSASPDGFPEGMNASGVNNSAREVMAAIARWRDGLVTKGSISTDINGFTSTVTTTIYYTHNTIEDAVTILIVGFDDTSNSTSTMVTQTALPSVVRPAEFQSFLAPVRDNGDFLTGRIDVATNGFISIHAGPNEESFTASNDKGINSISLTYSLDG